MFRDTLDAIIEREDRILEKLQSQDPRTATKARTVIRDLRALRFPSKEAQLEVV